MCKTFVSLVSAYACYLVKKLVQREGCAEVALLGLKGRPSLINSVNCHSMIMLPCSQHMKV